MTLLMRSEDSKGEPNSQALILFRDSLRAIGEFGGSCKKHRNYKTNYFKPSYSNELAVFDCSIFSQFCLIFAPKTGK